MIKVIFLADVGPIREPGGGNRAYQVEVDNEIDVKTALDPGLIADSAPGPEPENPADTNLNWLV